MSAPQPDAALWATGHCQCRAVTFACLEQPRSVHYCHCTQCRRAVSGPFAVLVWMSVDAVRGNLLGAASRRSSPIATRGFCRECGTPLFLMYDDSDAVGILVGTLDEPERFIPAYHYGVESRLPWVDCGAALPAEATSERCAPKPQDVTSPILRPSVEHRP
jgi:hypothetical protein